MSPITSMAQFIVLLFGWMLEEGGVWIYAEQEKYSIERPIIAEYEIAYRDDYGFTRSRWAIETPLDNTDKT